MKIVTTVDTVNEIKKIVESQPEQPGNVRIFLAGMGWSGPTLGLSLDEKKDTDLVDDANEISFVMDKDLHDQMGDIKVEFMGNGYMVAPVNQGESACGSCGGSCG